MEKYDVIVVGAGSVGMAAGYELAKKGARTLLLDAFDPPHTMGSHHGDTRIIRHAYGEGVQYVPLALRAQALWEEMASLSGMTLFVRTGVLGAGPLGNPFLEEMQVSAKEFSLPLEILSAEEINERWRGMNLPGNFYGCYEPEAGVLYSERCITAYRELATRLGAVLLPNTRVTDVKVEPNHVTVTTDQGSFQSEKLLVSAGAWNPALLQSLGLQLPLVPTRKTVAWFAADEQLYGAEKYPAFIFQLQDSSYYGFPSIDGTGVKIGRHDGGQPINPDQLDRTFGTYPSDEEDVRSFLEAYMPQAAGPLQQGRVCIYTLTPDEHFVIDRHPEYEHIVITAGFSGHGFKFASAIGESVSQLLTEGKSTHDLSLFSLKRF